jgi:hypothetical protein
VLSDPKPGHDDDDDNQHITVIIAHPPSFLHYCIPFTPFTKPRKLQTLFAGSSIWLIIFLFSIPSPLASSPTMQSHSPLLLLYNKKN